MTALKSLFSIFISVGLAWYLWANYFNGERVNGEPDIGRSISSDDTPRLLKKVVEDLNRDLPQMIAPDMRLNRVSSKGKIVEVHLTAMDFLVEELDLAYITANKKSMFVEDVCTDVAAKFMFLGDTKYRVKVRDKVDDFIFKVDIEASDCKR